MKIALIAALAENRVIGRDNALPWRLPDDLKRFRALTTGHAVLMGHRTYASIGKPLPKRTNIVLSRNPDTHYPDVSIQHDLEGGIQAATELGHDELFVIGGETVYAEALPRAGELHLTRVEAVVEGDAYFPEVDFSGEEPGGWKLAEAVPHPADEKHPFAFTFEQWVRQ